VRFGHIDFAGLIDDASIERHHLALQPFMRLDAGYFPGQRRRGAGRNRPLKAEVEFQPDAVTATRRTGRAHRHQHGGNMRTAGDDAAEARRRRFRLIEMIRVLVARFSGEALNVLAGEDVGLRELVTDFEHAAGDLSSRRR
jgi:hypothetical protein